MLRYQQDQVIQHKGTHCVWDKPTYDRCNRSDPCGQDIPSHRRSRKHTGCSWTSSQQNIYLQQSTHPDSNLNPPKIKGGCVTFNITDLNHTMPHVPDFKDAIPLYVFLGSIFSCQVDSNWGKYHTLSMSMQQYKIWPTLANEPAGENWPNIGANDSYFGSWTLGKIKLSIL